jgi:hypothetical protein
MASNHGGRSEAQNRHAGAVVGRDRPAFRFSSSFGPTDDPESTHAGALENTFPGRWQLTERPCTARSTSPTIVGGIGVGIEYAVYRVADDLMLCALMAFVVAYRFAQRSYVPATSYLSSGVGALHVPLISKTDRFFGSDEHEQMQRPGSHPTRTGRDRTHPAISSRRADSRSPCSLG